MLSIQDQVRQFEALNGGGKDLEVRRFANHLILQGGRETNEAHSHSLARKKRMSDFITNRYATLMAPLLGKRRMEFLQKAFPYPRLNQTAMTWAMVLFEIYNAQNGDFDKIGEIIDSLHSKTLKKRKNNKKAIIESIRKRNNKKKTAKRKI